MTEQPARFAEATFEQLAAFCKDPRSIEEIAGELGVEESPELIE